MYTAWLDSSVDQFLERSPLSRGDLSYPRICKKLTNIYCNPVASRFCLVVSPRLN